MTLEDSQSHKEKTEAKQRELPKESTPGDSHTSRHNEYEIDVYKLIQLTKEFPETEIALADYESELDDPCWTDSNGEKIMPRSVIEAYKNHTLEEAKITYPELAKHLQQIDRADYSHPVLIFNSKIIDGTHRLAKASVDGQISIKARIIDSIPEEAIIKLHSKENQ